VLTLPATSGTVVTTATTTGISGSAISTGTVGVSVGGTGRTTNTAYAVICGGTTTGGAEQSIASVGTSGQVLTSNGPGVLPTFQAAAAGGFSNLQVFTSSGTFTVPAGITKAKVTLCGGGGSGGNANGASGTGTYGAAGGVGIKLVTGLTPGASVSVTVGSGSGGTSSFGAFCSATGGGNGGNFADTAERSGGVGVSCDLSIPGLYATSNLAAWSWFSTYVPLGPLNVNSSLNANLYGYGAGGQRGNSNNTNTYTGTAGATGVVFVEY
jgi:hypothetical protein